ncbi:hypothetical protein DRG10_23110 [Shigella sonnei]|nr:hypothetical protein [Shigella sonnei]
MNDNSLLRNSSLFIAYMGCVGWVSAYSYGWGTSFYYGFPWWVVGAGLDDVARSLLYAIIVMGILFTGWGIGILFFLLIKKRSKIQDLSFFRLFFAITLLFFPVIFELLILKQYFILPLSLSCIISSLVISIIIRIYGRIFSVSCFSDIPFVREHRIKLIMAGFLVYFWLFSFLVGWYKPQLKKEYQMLCYNNSWYYILARYDSRLILSSSFKDDSNRFLIFNTEQSGFYEINDVYVRK